MWLLIGVLYVVVAGVLQWVFRLITGLLGFAVMAPGLIAQSASEKRAWASAIFLLFNIGTHGIIGLVVSVINVALIVIVTAWIATLWLPDYERTLWVVAALWAFVTQRWFGLLIVGSIALGAFR